MGLHYVTAVVVRPSVYKIVWRK